MGVTWYRFHVDPIQEIKLRLPIEEVVSGYVSLKKAGHHLKGLCPFHQEKTPSFMVSPEKGIAYCFGCQKGGDVFRFVMEAEHLDFRGALELLADKAGVTLPDVRPQAAQEKTRILELQKRAQEFFRATLAGPEGVTARETLAKRGVSDEMIERFGIGAAPASWDAMAKRFQREAITETDLVLAGLAVRRDQARDGVYDRFRSRLMFPLRDPGGRVLAFTGRSLDGSEPKYLNSPESATFSKGTFLYGLDVARDAIKREGKALLVEGQMDVVACHQFGVTNAVASSGTALTEHHLSALSKIAPSALFCFDGDTAGTNATLRGLQMALNTGMHARAVILPSGKDPDESFRANEEATREALAAPVSVETFLLSVLKKRYDLHDNELKRQAIQEFFAFARGLSDPLVVEPLLLDAAGVFGVRPEYFREGYEQTASSVTMTRAPVVDVQPETAPVRPEDLLVGILLDRPTLLPTLALRLRGGEVLGAEPRRLYDVVVRAAEEGQATDTAAVLTFCPEELRPRAEFLLLAVEKHFSSGEAADVDAEVVLITDRVVGDFVRRRNREIAAALKDARPEEQVLLTEELQQLLRERERPSGS